MTGITQFTQYIFLFYSLLASPCSFCFIEAIVITIVFVLAIATGFVVSFTKLKNMNIEQTFNIATAFGPKL